MSDILIKGMEMPTNCCQCPVNMEVCKRGYEYLLKHPELYDKRADDCPLVPVQPHGRLIDADELEEKHRELAYELRGANYDFHITAKAWVDNAPTVIEEER